MDMLSSSSIVLFLGINVVVEEMTCGRSMGWRRRDQPLLVKRHVVTNSTLHLTSSYTPIDGCLDRHIKT